MMSETESLSPEPPPPAPPGVELARRFSTRDFLEACDGCGDCAAVCPDGLIVIGADRRPRLLGTEEACGGCGLCADVCTRGAIDPDGLCETEARRRTERIGSGLARLLAGEPEPHRGQV